MTLRLTGAGVDRPEDDRLVVGRGRFLDDVHVPTAEMLRQMTVIDDG